MTRDLVTDVPTLPPRRLDAHKGDFGRVLVIGGSTGMIGAPALAALAALRGGAGLVTVAVPATIQQAVATLCPCAMSIPLAVDGTGDLDDAAMPQLLDAIQAADVVAAGPGLVPDHAQQQLVRLCLSQGKPLVLDAGALRCLARIDDWPAKQAGPVVLTPHPGEFAQLTHTTAAPTQTHRKSAACQASTRWADAQGENAPPCVLVLKGAGTLVVDKTRLFVNTTGNPGLATAGSGDVLTGLLAAHLAQGLAPFEAACLAVHQHGLAGDHAAQRLSQTALIATDLLEELAHTSQDTPA